MNKRFPGYGQTAGGHAGRSRVEPVATDDQALAEVVQGFVDDHDVEGAKAPTASLTTSDSARKIVATQAATNYRVLRTLGITVGKTIHTLIATHGMENNRPLLYSLRDFDPFIQHLVLRSAME